MFNIGMVLELISAEPTIVGGVMKLITEIESGYKQAKASGGDVIVVVEDIIAALVANKGSVAMAVLGPEPTVTASGAPVTGSARK